MNIFPPRLTQPMSLEDVAPSGTTVEDTDTAAGTPAGIAADERPTSPVMDTKGPPPRVTAPAYRHAAPSGPWPWMNLDDEPEHDVEQPRDPSYCSHKPDECGQCWKGYPQSLFPNWKPAQVERCRMKEIPKASNICTVYEIDVFDDAKFKVGRRHVVKPGGEDIFWQTMQEKYLPKTRLRAIFVQNLTVPVLEMLGTKYNIEPFFFSSSLNWIPSRFQEDPQDEDIKDHERGDHITITLTFIRPIKTKRLAYRSLEEELDSDGLTREKIDTNAPLRLSSDDELAEDNLLLQDLLAIHMIRSPGNSTIISLHPSHDRQQPPQPNKSPGRLHSRVDLAGQSVYWNHIFEKTEDPTFVLLTILWHALYAWDETLETLWEHIGMLELNIITSSDLGYTKELHQIRAHLLHYISLLEDFQQTVEFVRDTPNPAMTSPRYNQAMLDRSKRLLERECKNLSLEAKRLLNNASTQSKRLKNVLALVFSSVNIGDSRRMQDLTEAAVRDSVAMKQIAYLTMFFLPASFCTGVFGMNIAEINPGTLGTIWKYFATALPLTAATIWIVIALQGRWHKNEDPYPIMVLKRLSWPIMFIHRLLMVKKEKEPPQEQKSGGPTSNDAVIIEMERRGRGIGV